MAQFTDDAVETIEQDILPGLNFVAVTGFNTADGLRLDQRGDAGYYEHYLAKKGCTIQVYKRVLEINTGGVRMDRHKTVGTISIKNSEKVLMSAHSGYTSRPERENLCLDTQKWNSLALHNLAKQLNFKFPKSQRDNARFTVQDEHRGRAHAGHVEVLLACWFVVEMTRRSFNLVNEPAERVITQIKRLKTVDLGDYRTAFITIDSEPCRTCLDFLNRISQYTRIGFTIFGSHGIGPIQVRVDGRRREDIVGDTMPDSSYDEASEGGEDGEGGGGGGGGTGQPDTFTQKELTPAAPTTPAPRSVRRPGRWRTGQWSPENPEQLLNSYKKGTPVYEFPGYQPAIQPSRHERSAQPNIVQDQQQHTDIGDHWEHIGREETDIQNDWVDLGDGLMIQQHGSPNVHQDDQVGLAGDGEAYARAAYDLMNEASSTDAVQAQNAVPPVIRRPRRRATPSRNSSRSHRHHGHNHNHNHSSRRHHRHNSHHEPTFVANLPQRSLQPIRRHLQEFRHRQRDQVDESILRRKYSLK